MLITSAKFHRKESDLEPRECVVDKVIRLSGTEYDHFARNMLRDQDFIKDNPIERIVDTDGRYHCLLVVGEGRRDGILVNSEGGDYARYSALIPNVEAFLTVGQYPALAELNKKLTDIVDFIAQPNGQRHVFNIEGFETMSGIDFEFNDAMLQTVLGMLNEKQEIADVELDGNELIVYYSADALEQSEDLSDPTVTYTDMYAYGYGWEGMIPLGKERALELFDNGYEVFRLYDNDAEGAADSRESIETFDGMFGIEDPEWDRNTQLSQFEVFILNRESYDRGESRGEWLTLPADADTLRGLFERIGIDRPSENAYTVSAIRVPHEFLCDYVLKYDDINDINMLASIMDNLEDFEIDKLRAILSSRVTDYGNNLTAVINLLYDDNFNAFELIGAKDAEALGRYYDVENEEKPDGISFEEYGKQCIKDEKGVFTESGYIKFKYKELLSEYTGVVPDEYKITGEALRGLRAKVSERGGSGEKPSVLKQIRESQKIPKPPRKEKKPDKKKEGPEL